MNFIKNNWPEAIGPDGKFTGKVNWRDKEVFFMETGSSGETNEQMGFVTANLNIGDSQVLLELIIDCMCIAAEVTESILLRAKSENGTTGEEFERFKKKIERKRDNLAPYIQRLVRMAMYITMSNPVTPQLSWYEVDVDDLINLSTAFNNEVTALEVLSRSQVISRQTYRASIRRFIPAMKADAIEEAAAQADLQKENQQQLDLQKEQAKISNSGNGNGNGGGPNSATTRTRVRQAVPLEVVPSQPGE
jgi:hypothetical protein